MAKDDTYDGPLVRCATCGADQPPYCMGDYGDGLPRCLRKAGVGGACWKHREFAPKAQGEAFAEAAL